MARDLVQKWGPQADKCQRRQAWKQPPDKNNTLVWPETLSRGPAMPRLDGDSGSCHASDGFRGTPGHATQSNTNTSTSHLSLGGGSGGGTLHTWGTAPENDTGAVNGDRVGKGSSTGQATQPSRPGTAAVSGEKGRALGGQSQWEKHRAAPRILGQAMLLPQRTTHHPTTAPASLAMAHRTTSERASRAESCQTLPVTRASSPLNSDTQGTWG